MQKSTPIFTAPHPCNFYVTLRATATEEKEGYFLTVTVKEDTSSMFFFFKRLANI
jgi:hypothetical protein